MWSLNRWKKHGKTTKEPMGPGKKQGPTGTQTPDLVKAITLFLGLITTNLEVVKVQ